MIWRTLFVVALPIVAFAAGVLIMSKLSDRTSVDEKLALTPFKDGKPLNQRFHYDAAAVERYWKALGDALPAERYFLKLDLVFPMLYGGALAASLLIVWAMLGRPFAVAWLVGPVAVAAVADWTENLIQLTQMRRFGHEGVQAGWIAGASFATLVKMVMLGLMFLALFVLIGGLWLGRPPGRP